jgi:uncharacterized repeat protein (TIGR01451 family)
MFRKLVSNLSFSPGVVSQMAFYARRLKRENLTRRLSVVFGVGVLAFQILAVIVPPVASNAAAPNNDIIGYVGSPQAIIDGLNRYPDARALYDSYGLGDNEILNMHFEYIPATHSNLLSFGRQDHYPSYPISAGGTTFYARTLSSIATTATASAWVGTNRFGQYIAVLRTCGNLEVSGAVPPPPPPPPPPPAVCQPGQYGTPPNCVTPPATVLVLCQSLKANPTTGHAPITINYTGSGSTQHTTITRYVFDFGDGGTQVTTTSPTITHTYAHAGTYVARLRVGNATTLTDYAAICNTTITVAEALVPNIEKAKSAVITAIDGTQRPGNNGTAQAGETITYTLTTKNTGTGPEKGYVVTEQLADILEYADVTDLGGGTLTKTTLAWPKVDIAAGKALTNSFKVKVKDPIPVTARSTDDINSFDLKLENVYGNPVVVNVSPPPAKQLEAGSTALPQTGAGTSIMITFAVVGAAVYLYMRNRQLAAEIKVLSSNYHPGAL